MDYGQHLVTSLVCFVKAEGRRGLLSGGLWF